jgi:hypothetical protein
MKDLQLGFGLTSALASDSAVEIRRTLTFRSDPNAISRRIARKRASADCFHASAPQL